MLIIISLFRLHSIVSLFLYTQWRIFTDTQLSAYAPAGYNNKKKTITCKQCTAKQTVNLTCMTCTKTKPLEHFARVCITPNTCMNDIFTRVPSRTNVVIMKKHVVSSVWRNVRKKIWKIRTRIIHPMMMSYAKLGMTLHKHNNERPNCCNNHSHGYSPLSLSHASALALFDVYTTQWKGIFFF